MKPRHLLSSHLLSKIGLLLFSSVLITACDNDDNDAPAVQQPPPPPAMASFDVTVGNISNAQPLSPIALVVHDDRYAAFDIGETSSPGLEQLAEAGDNGDFIAEADQDAAVSLTATGTGPVPPGMSETLSFSIEESELAAAQLTILSMLVNTNDAFSGANGIALGGLEANDELIRYTVAYDAGTELNTEAAVSIPGPAAGGEGFNAARDDRNDFVTMHAGVVGQQDGLAGSGLSQDHRFDNPTMRISVVRTQ